MRRSLCLLIAFIVSSAFTFYYHPPESVASSKSENTIPQGIQLKEGNLILRNSNGLLSSFFRNCSIQEKKFSHAGLLKKINDQWFVYHFMDGETSGLNIETLNSFIDKKKCNQFAIYKFALSESQQMQLLLLIDATKSASITFDNAFDLSTDSKMYCTEWVAKLINRSAGCSIIPYTSVSGVFFYAPDNLYLNSYCSKVYEKRF